MQTTSTPQHLTPNTQHLTPQQHIAVEALLLGHKQVAAARLVGVSDRTLRTWHGLPAFRQALADGREALNLEAKVRLQAASNQALDRLTGILHDRNSRTSEQISACRVLLTLGMKAAGLEAQHARLAELEAEIAELRSQLAALSPEPAASPKPEAPPRKPEETGSGADAESPAGPSLLLLTSDFVSPDPRAVSTVQPARPPLAPMGPHPRSAAAAPARKRRR